MVFEYLHGGWRNAAALRIGRHKSGGVVDRAGAMAGMHLFLADPSLLGVGHR
jgi:hypothetical protein